MKALSIRQPWAWAIMNVGKDVENRSWGDRYPGLAEARQLIGSTILIHAGMTMTKREYEEVRDDIRVICRVRPPGHPWSIPAQDQMQLGGIVGQARLHAVVTRSSSPWFFGPIGLELRDAKPLPFVPLKGALGFFDVPDAVVCAAEQLFEGG